MAIEVTFLYENAKEFLSETLENDARPIIILEADEDLRERFSNELFALHTSALKISFQDFLSHYVYSIQKQQEMLDFSHVVVDNVEKLRGLSATLKILSTFIDNMIAHNVSVIFMGNNVSYDMKEVIQMSGSKIQCIMKIEPERINEE